MDHVRCACCRRLLQVSLSLPLSLSPPPLYLSFSLSLSLFLSLSLSLSLFMYTYMYMYMQACTHMYIHVHAHHALDERTCRLEMPLHAAAYTQDAPALSPKPLCTPPREKSFILFHTRQHSNFPHPSTHIITRVRAHTHCAQERCAISCVRARTQTYHTYHTYTHTHIHTYTHTHIHLRE